MSKQQKIPVHKMHERFSGVYVAPLNAGTKASKTASAYEKSEPHRHDFYYCVLLEKGEMEIEVDFQQVHFGNHSLFLSYPGQIHQVNTARMERGWFFAFDPSMLGEPLKDILDQFLSEVILLPLSATQCSNFSSLVQQLYTVNDDQAQLFRREITRSMLTTLVYQVAAAYLSVESERLIRHATRSITITKSFKQQLRRHFRSLKKPSAYAALLYVSAGYLNDTVKAVTGFSVTYYIQQELMREAQRLLYYSTHSISEIADQLGFEDEKYFSRLFSKVTGTSPAAFRKQLHRQ